MSLEPNHIQIYLVEESQVLHFKAKFPPSNIDQRTFVPKPYILYFPGMIDQKNITVKAHVELDSILIINPVTTTHPFAGQKSYDPDDPANIYDFGVTKRVPLGKPPSAESEAVLVAADLVRRTCNSRSIRRKRRQR